MRTSRVTLNMFFALFALTLLVPPIIGISFASNPRFNNGLQVFTDDNLVCAWGFENDAVAQNITISYGGTIYYSRNETGDAASLNTSATLLSGNSSKNQLWTCAVTLDNSTDTVTRETNVTIQNSAPETPVVYNESDTSIGTAYNVTEDTPYTFDVNATDPDSGDVLTYYFKAATQGFCTMMDANEGIANCTPTQSDHDGTPTVNNITFWVDDDDSIKAKSSSLKVSFTVYPHNDAPTISLTDQTTPVDTTLNYPMTASDEESNYPLNFSLLDIPTTLVGDISITNTSGNEATFTYDASSIDYDDVNETGWLITVNITDTENASTIETFLLKITSVGRSPYFLNITPEGPYVINQSEPFQINITANDLDDDDTLTFLDDTAFFNISTVETRTNVTNASGQINFTPTDAAVGDFNVTITIVDRESKTNTTILEFTVLNINDPPEIYNISGYAANTGNNDNISNVTSYVNVRLVFVVNATDPDLDSGDNLTFGDNTTLFDIDPTTGIINFTPSPDNVSDTPYSILINVTDESNETAWTIMTLWILNNSIPYFSPDVPDTECNESALCTLDLSTYATDADIPAGDSIVLYEADFLNQTIGSFDLNTTSGLINFTPLQSEIGAYRLNITITDSRGATNSTVFNLTVNNTPDTPILVDYNFSNRVIVETHSFYFQLSATDKDLNISGGDENLTFQDNLTFTTITYQYDANGTAYALLSFTPTSTEVANHSIRINVTDRTGRYDEQIFTFEVLPVSTPPNITHIKPYGNVSDSYNIVDELIATTDSQFTSNTATVRLYENNNYTFEHRTTDDRTPNASLNFSWYYDNQLVSTNYTYPASFNYFSRGSHAVKLIVFDDTLENSTWNWALTVVNVNRAPVLTNDLPTPIETNVSYFYESYFYRDSPFSRFLDPDDDVDGGGSINGTEVNRLNFTHTVCDVATLAISGANLTVTPEEVGSCTVRFYATDLDGSSTVSNQVVINITEIDEGGTEETVVTVPAGGGGSSSTRSTYIPLTKKTEVPVAINIIAPKFVSILDNSTVAIPVTIENPWTDTLESIQIWAETNDTLVTATPSSNFIESLEPNESVDLEVIVDRYRLGASYETKIFANVSDPSVEDSAIVFLSSIEQTSAGEKVNVKVTFARDLFNEHPECQELNELLDKAEDSLATGDVIEASRAVDAAINGCKYVVSSLEPRLERPGMPQSISLDDMTLETIIYIALAIVVLMTISFIVYYHYTSKEEDEI